MTTRRKEAFALFTLLILWLLFFWRLLTPITADQASLKQGDFSGQFVTFATYQYNRLTAGEIPLWNPYNNGGLPFLADTQAAVFYPPRLLTIALSNLTDSWGYHALELEMAVHALLNSVLMYIFMRRLTAGRTGSITASLAAALIATYGGFLTGYPPLQLAVLEAAIWLPLALLGILEATRQPDIRHGWLAVAGVGLGLSWLAGHPQTSWFLTYLLVAYTIYRCWVKQYRWPVISSSIIFIGIITGGLAAVQLLPGVEYLAHTARVDLSYDAKANGFPFKDLLQVIFPTQLSLFSPMYIGITALGLVLAALWRNVPEKRFWAITAFLALGLSFGGNSVIFPALYNLLPGLRFFRGQERAIYLAANSLAVLAGLTICYIIDNPSAMRLSIKRTYLLLAGIGVIGITQAHTGWLSENHEQALSIAVFSTLIALLALAVITRLPNSTARGLLIALLVFDLFTITMDAESTYDPIPASEQLSMQPPPLVAAALADGDITFRVDGFRGLTDNYGSMYGLADMRGISPLFLEGPYQLIEPEKINPLAWELFAVRYVYSDWQELPVPSTIIAAGEDRYGSVNLHKLDDPRPFAHLVYDYALVDSDSFARALLHTPEFNPRTSAILYNKPPVPLTTTEGSGTVTITDFQPETIRLQVSTTTPALLSLAVPQYPGWQAALNNETIPILRAYGGLSALSIPAGDHTLTLTYAPLTYTIGALLSLVTSLTLSILGIVWVIRRRI